MTDSKQMDVIYKQNLENDIIKEIARLKGIELRTAIDIYYSSKLASQIAAGNCGIENMDAKYLAEDLIENEADLFFLNEKGERLAEALMEKMTPLILEREKKTV